MSPGVVTAGVITLGAELPTEGGAADRGQATAPRLLHSCLRRACVPSPPPPIPPTASGNPSPFLARASSLQLSLSFSLSASLLLALGGRWMSGVYTRRGRRAG